MTAFTARGKSVGRRAPSSDDQILAGRFHSGSAGFYQTTLSAPITFAGNGIHSALPARMVVGPAEAGAGICFLRSDLPVDAQSLTPALWSGICGTQLHTRLRIHKAESVSTVEHILAALSGLGVDNAIITLDGPEVPILDGSAADYVAAIDAAGLRVLRAPKRFLHILKPVRVERDGAFAALLPSPVHDAAPMGLEVDVAIAFQAPVIGRQRRVMRMDAGVFRREIARARTFGFVEDVARLWREGFARGASLENTIALTHSAVLNPEGLRFRDEFVRHKILDAIGDLALAGAPILGRFQSSCGGHSLNFMVLQALFSNPSAYRFIQPTVLPAYGTQIVGSRPAQDADVLPALL